MGDGLCSWIEQWLELLPDKRPKSWLFSFGADSDAAEQRQLSAAELLAAAQTSRIGMGQLPGDAAEAFDCRQCRLFERPSDFLTSLVDQMPIGLVLAQEVIAEHLLGHTGALTNLSFGR